MDDYLVEYGWHAILMQLRKKLRWLGIGMAVFVMLFVFFELVYFGNTGMFALGAFVLSWVCVSITIRLLAECIVTWRDIHVISSFYNGYANQSMECEDPLSVYADFVETLDMTGVEEDVVDE